MKTISAGWRPQSLALGGRCDEDYISRLEFAVWGLGGDGMKAISAGWRPQSGAGGGRKVG